MFPIELNSINIQWTASTFDFLASYILSAVVALVVTRPFANMVIALLKPGKRKADIPEKDKSIDNFSNVDSKDIKNLNIIFRSNDVIVYRL